MVCTGEVCLKVADHFLGWVAVPEGVGKGPARVTLSFPDCPAGRVEPRTYEVFFNPSGPPRRSGDGGLTGGCRRVPGGVHGNFLAARSLPPAELRVMAPLVQLLSLERH